jgi:hypothetical protein
VGVVADGVAAIREIGFEAVGVENNIPSAALLSRVRAMLSVYAGVVGDGAMCSVGIGVVSVAAVWFGNVGVGAINLVRSAPKPSAMGQWLLFALVLSALQQWVLSAYNISWLVGSV